MARDAEIFFTVERPPTSSGTGPRAEGSRSHSPNAPVWDKPKERSGHKTLSAAYVGRHSLGKVPTPCRTSFSISIFNMRRMGSGAAETRSPGQPAATG